MKRILEALLCTHARDSAVPGGFACGKHPSSYTFDISEGDITISAGTSGGLKVTYGATPEVVDNITAT
jgi:hypothetical protein